jgi:death on curing protein
MEYLDLADYLLIAEAALDVPVGQLTYAADLRLADSALAAPRNAAAYADADLAEQAAVLCSHVARNHALPDGNKRVGYVAMREFIERNGAAWTPPGAAATVAMIEAVAAGTVPDKTFATWVRDNIQVPV